MNEIIAINPEQTMTSLQIAEITGKNHFDVMRAIRKMEPAWEKVNESKFTLVEYTDAKGEKRPCYSLTKTECLYIATKFNDEARAKLVLRWQELEMATSPKVPMSFREALLLAAEQQGRIEEQQKCICAQSLTIDEQDKTIAKLQPKADFADAAFSSDTLISMSQAAKILKLPFGRNTLFKKLKEDGIFFKNKNEPLQRYVDAKYFQLVEGKPIDTSKGVLIPVMVYCTQKGLAYINLKYGNKDNKIPQLAKIK